MTRNNRPRNDRIWALTLALIAVHQSEEVLVSVEDWHDRVGTTTMPWLDRHLEGNWMAAHEPWKRLVAQAGQGLALATLWRLTRRNDRATRIATTALCTGWSAAFAMHLTASWRTRTIMPGTSTSVLPGHLGAAWVLREIWRSPGKPLASPGTPVPACFP